MGIAVSLSVHAVLAILTRLIYLQSILSFSSSLSDPRQRMQMVEGIVADVGWYRTLIRSFEREMFTIPNSVFSRNVVLNITRKNKEWRFFEFFGECPSALPLMSLRMLCTMPVFHFPGENTCMLEIASVLFICNWWMVAVGAISIVV